MTDSEDIWTFERFVEGEPVGVAGLVLDEVVMDRWRAVYPEFTHRGSLIPPTLLMPVFMRLYAEAVAPRPPGNIHAGQHLELTRLPEVGTRIEAAFSCHAKEARKGRRFVTNEGVVSDAGGELFRGRIATIWAA